MQPRNKENGLSFLQKTNNANHAWLSVSMTSYYVPRSKFPERTTNGLARVLKSWLSRFDKPIKAGPFFGEKEEVKLHYSIAEVDKTTGLQWSTPLGSHHVEKSHSWNQTLYWQGDQSSVIDDLIDCGNGILPNPKSYSKCRHMFDFPEMKISILLVYPRTWLPQWAQLKKQSKSLLQSFIENNP